MGNTIIYIGNFNVSKNDAASQLVISNGKILRDIGYKVIFVGNNPCLKSNIDILETKTQLNGFDIYSVPFNKSLKSIWSLYNQIKKILQLNKHDIKSVVLYGSPVTPAFLAYKISMWTKVNEVLFIGNNADVSAMSHGTVMERILKVSNYSILRYILKKRTHGTIAVSNYIQKYYTLPGKKSVIIPPLVELENPPPLEETSSEIIKIVYAGTPFPIDGRKVAVSSYKDRLDVVIEMLSEVYKNKKNFHLNIYGLSKEQYTKVIKSQEKLLDKNKNMITFHGYTSHSQIKKNISKADFTINLRDSNQMTNAGFSTKFVESVSCGTPAITTNTSDLRDYLVEGENGFFIDITNKENGIKKLNEILSLSKLEIRKMKNISYNSGAFDYKKYINKMQDFLISLED